MAIEPVCRCKKCGREFVTMPTKWPAFDWFYPANKVLHRMDMPTDEQCGGELEPIPRAPAADEVR